jgi:tetratricopeptide (TPR) repeat protein
MPATTEREHVPLVEAVPTRFADAARLLEHAVKLGSAGPELNYQLALTYKRQGKIAEARQALGRIPDADASVFLQMGILALEEHQLAQAEQEFARALELDPTCYEAARNLLLTRLTLGQLAACLAQLSDVLKLAPSPDENRFLSLLQVVLHHCPKKDQALDLRSLSPIPDTAPLSVDADEEPSGIELLHRLTAEEESRLVELLAGVEDSEAVLALLKTVRAARPDSALVNVALLEAVLAEGKALFDRCEWPHAEHVLAALARDRSLLQAAPRDTQVAVLNLLGCCACLNQNIQNGLQHFAAALHLAPSDLRLHQNMALAWEWAGNLVKADPHWNRFLDLLHSGVSGPSGWPDYAAALAFEALTRLAGRYTEAENWSAALPYIERGLRLRPDDTDLLEQLFRLYKYLKRSRDARQTLARLQELHPGEPQWELYELDLVEINTLVDMELVLTEIDRIARRHPKDARVEERAVALVGNIFPWLGNRCEQLSEQLYRVRDQLRSLPSYQVNWSAVQEVTRDLRREFQRLRKIASKCFGLVKSDEHRRAVRELMDLLERRLNDCRRLDE